MLTNLRWIDVVAVTVMLALAGYPTGARKGDSITGVDSAEALDGVHVLHAGTGTDAGALVTAGGRVLSVVGRGTGIAGARAAAYAGVQQIAIDGGQYRTDIAAGR